MGRTEEHDGVASFAKTRVKPLFLPLPKGKDRANTSDTEERRGMGESKGPLPLLGVEREDVLAPSCFYALVAQITSRPEGECVRVDWSRTFSVHFCSVMLLDVLGFGQLGGILVRWTLSPLTKGKSAC